MRNRDKPYAPAELKILLSESWVLIKSRQGLLLLGLVLIMIGRLAGLVIPASTKYLIDDIIGQGNLNLLAPLVLAVLGATLVKGLTAFSLIHLVSKATQRFITDLRRKVQAHIVRLPVTYFDDNKTGSLVSRVMSDVEALGNLIGPAIIELSGGLITAVIALILLVSISPWLTVVALTPVFLLMLILRFAFAKLRPIFLDRRIINAEVTGRLTESLGGVRIVKSYNAETREERVFSAGVQRLLSNVLKSLTGISVLKLAQTLLLGITGALIMYLGARQVFSGALTLGEFVQFIAFLAVMVGPMSQAATIGTQFTEALAGLERIREVLSERREDENSNRSVTLSTISGEIRFEKVDFAYNQGKNVLHEVSLIATPGTVTALVGPSGSGKSTVIGLIAAFHSPSAGKVRVDGVDLSTVDLSSYRTQLGVVLQQPFLFDGTIKENVTFARPEATAEEILEACRIAHVDEFAETLEEQYDTLVGERGVKLSGGQCQRVSIARAILANPRILILDEATSSLDPESEALIQEGLKHLLKDRTTFVIAHRLSTIRRADHVIVMEGGRIVERGTYESLYARGGKFFELYTRRYRIDSNLFLTPGEGVQLEDGDVVAAPTLS